MTRREFLSAAGATMLAAGTRAVHGRQTQADLTATTIPGGEALICRPG